MDSAKDRTGPSARFFRWRPAAWLRVTGEDAFTFLQGQFSNDLRKMDGGAVYGLWLDHKGRVTADSFVLAAGADAFWIGSYFSAGAAIKERLESFIVADDVKIEDFAADWMAVTLFGTECPPILAGAEGPGVQFTGRRGLTDCREWVFPCSAKAEVEAKLSGWSTLSRCEMEQWRIAACIAAVPADIGLADLPHEGGLESDAVADGKGCYVGQEVMARLRTMGQVRRRLLPVRGAGAIPPLPAALFQGERKLGELRSAVAEADGFAGLALLSLLNLRREATLSFTSGASTGAVALVNPS